jgi:hypothetical protein
MRLDRSFWLISAAVVAACAPVCLVAWFGPPVAAGLVARLPILRNATEAALVVGACLLIYGLCLAPLLARFGVMPRLSLRRVAAAPQP